MSAAMVAKTGDRIALEIWFRTHILLEGIEPMKRIFRVQLLENVTCELIDLHWARRKCCVSVRAAVWQGDELGQCSRCGKLSRAGRNECLLVRRYHLAVLQNALVLSQAFIASEEESVVPPDRSACRHAEVISLERSLRSSKTHQR